MDGLSGICCTDLYNLASEFRYVRPADIGSYVPPKVALIFGSILYEGVSLFPCIMRATFE